MSHSIDNNNFIKRLWGNIYLYVLLLILYSPIIIIIIGSFTTSKVFGNWSGFSFGLYNNLFTGQAGINLNNAIINTALIALFSAIISTILGTFAAIGIFNMRQPARSVVDFVNQIPMINPDIITGISLFLLFVAIGLQRGMLTVVIAHVVFCTPYVILSILPRLQKMDANIYEAALDLGATPFQAFYKIMIPELKPGIISGFILSITLSIDDFGVTLFTKGSGGLETLSTFIYADARKGGVTPELRALFSIIFLTILVFLIIINVHSKKQNNDESK